MVGVAQLVEPRIVIPVVVGSSPIVHPISCTLCRNDDDKRFGKPAGVTNRRQPDLLLSLACNAVVGVAQLVEPRIVIPVVVGSSPIVHPISRYFSCIFLF